MIQSISALIPNHEERIQSIQAVEDFRLAQRKYIKSESEQLEDEIIESSRALRKTDSIAQIEARREEALKNLFLQQDPHTKGLGKRKVPPKTTDFKVPQPIKLQSSVQRRGSMSKCKSMSSIVHEGEDFHQSEEEFSSDCNSEGDPDSKSSSKRNGSVKRSKSFNKNNSDEEKTKTKQKKFANFFGKKSKSKSDEKHQDPEVVIVDTKESKKKVEKEVSHPPIGERTSSESRKSRPNGGHKKGKRSNSDSDYNRNNNVDHTEPIEKIPERKGSPRRKERIGDLLSVRFSVL